MNPLERLTSLGQSFWLDYIRRSFIESGELEKMILQDKLSGVTSNPSIFEKAITESTDYAGEIDNARCDAGIGAEEIYEQLVIHDIRAAADRLVRAYEDTGAGDGYVSLEVSPELARDTEGTIAEARRLWIEVDRKNLMIKVPATPEGIAAFEKLTAEGVNVNVTLLFSQAVYDQVARAYLSGLEQRARRDRSLKTAASVASFFVSRIDTAVDARLTEKLKSAPAAQQTAIRALLGRAAIANAKGAYRRFREIFSGARWEALQSKGARPQRLLWASTSTKNPAYSDVLYVEELVGADTVNTMPPATAAAFRDHGRVHRTLEEDQAGAERVLAEIQALGISMDEVTAGLLREGVDRFATDFRRMIDAIGQSVSPAVPENYSAHLPGVLAETVDREVDRWQSKVPRLWRGDSDVWTGHDEDRWLGWLRVAGTQLTHLDYLTNFATEVRAAEFRYAVVLGMGGSSLAAEVLARTFGQQPGFPELLILDSTDPAQIRTLESRLDLARTLFIVSSKSGKTLEPNLFHTYFYERVKEAAGAEIARAHFIAITDPGSPLDVALSNGFHRVFHGFPSIGGRYSALSDFGMVPAAAMGLDCKRLLSGADKMAQACGSCVPSRKNPGVLLGVALGALAAGGIDKVTIVASPAIHAFGAWLEQLLAESTGKQGRGLIPVDSEPRGDAADYGNDRLFAYLRFTPQPDPGQDSLIDALTGRGHPVVRIDIADRYDLGEEFLRWEFATAVAGSIIGINPFDQPDVESSKAATRKLNEEYERTGRLPVERPVFEADGMRVFADHGLKPAATNPQVADFLRAHLDRLDTRDYFAVLAYVERNPANERLLQEIRRRVRDAGHVATCLGFGPRFLHSTGQAYKGGPNRGVFLQITCDDMEDLGIPGHKATFGIVKAAQARGDFDVMAERSRRLLRVHISGPLEQGLRRLNDAVAQAIAAAAEPAQVA